MLNMMYPGNRGLIVRKHFSDVRASTISQTLLEEVIPESHIPENGHNKGNHEVKHYTGFTDSEGEPIFSEIHYHGLDSGKQTSDDDLPRKIGSTAYGWIFVDEGTELSRGEWSQLQGRLRYKGKRQGGNYYTIPFRQIFTATNPASPQHWMYKMFFEEGNGEVIQMNLHDNPHLPQDYVERQEKMHSGMYYERYVQGKWVGAEGIIYPEWDGDLHLVAPENLPEAGAWEIHREKEYHTNEGAQKAYWADPPGDWRIYRSIDFGYNNPFVCQWWARSPDDILVLFREIYETNLRVDRAAEKINDLTSDDWVLEQTFCDHDAEDSETLRHNGVAAANAKKDVSPGIQSVKRRFEPDDRGVPGLYVMQGARVHPPDEELMMDDKPTCTHEEVLGYTWKDSDQEDKPEKEDDHGMDAMRYLVFSVDEGNTITQEEMRQWNNVIQDAW